MFFRISKYDPQYRAADGVYTRDEWTDISVFEDYHQDWDEYLKIETAYWTWIRELLEQIGIWKVAITNIERHVTEDQGISLLADALSFLDQNPPANAQYVGLDDLEHYYRAALRGAFWFYGVGDDTTHFGFGYESYCYLRTDRDVVIPSVPDVFVEDVSHVPWPFEIAFEAVTDQPKIGTDP